MHMHGCVDGKLGDFCEILDTVASDTCPNDGWKLLPGRNDGRLFRCGEVISYAVFDSLTSSWVGGVEGGWWGHCVPAGVMNNGNKNCGDNSDEGTSDPATCQWPFIKKADGTCKECEDSDVSTKCAPGQAISSDTQQSCICQKCIDGWIGSECEIETNGTPKDQPVEEECVDNPKDKFFYKTKGKNKKPVYKKCSWLGKKSKQSISKICGKKVDSYNGTGPAKDTCKVLCGTCP